MRNNKNKVVFKQLVGSFSVTVAIVQRISIAVMSSLVAGVETWDSSLVNCHRSYLMVVLYYEK